MWWFYRNFRKVPLLFQFTSKRTKHLIIRFISYLLRFTLWSVIAVSRIGRTMYFHRRLLPIFKMCRSVSKKSQFVSNKNIRPWKVLEGFLFTHCKASKNPLRFCCSHSLVFFFFYALQLVKCVEFSWDNLCFINWDDKINWPPWKV